MLGQVISITIVTHPPIAQVVPVYKELWRGCQIGKNIVATLLSEIHTDTLDHSNLKS